LKTTLNQTQVFPKLKEMYQIMTNYTSSRSISRSKGMLSF